MGFTSGLRSTLCGLPLLGIASSASANHVDFITDGAFSAIVADSGSGVVTDTQIGSGDNILGTEREVALSFDSGNGLAATSTPTGTSCRSSSPRSIPERAASAASSA